MRVVALAARLAPRTLGTLAALAFGVPGTVGPAAASRPPAAVHLGVVAEEPNEPDKMLRIFAELLARLREQLQPRAVRVGGLVIARDLDDLSQRILRGDVDFVIETVFPTLALQERTHCVEPSLVIFRRGQREYRSVFFTRQESPIRELADLRGKTLVLQVLRSTSAFALPKAELERAGLTLVPADDLRSRPGDVRYVLAQAEVNQAIWVLHGKGDAGAFNDGNWAALPEKVRARLRVFHQTAPIVRGLLSFRSGLDATVRRAVEEALLRLPDDEAGRVALFQAAGLTGFERLTAEDRAGLRRWAPVLRPSQAR